MGAYLRLVGALAHNLACRLREDLADCAAVCKRGLLYKLRSMRRYDDVGPAGTEEDFHMPPHQLALLVEGVRNKPWYCELDRKAAQEMVQSGSSGCFLIRPSASTKSLTLTLWYRHRAFNILIRQREDGLLALGSRKEQEMTFHTVEEMVRYYEREPLILYSSGQQAGLTRLKAPPPGLVIGANIESRGGSARNSSDGCSSGGEIPHRQGCTKTLSSGHETVPFSSSVSKRLAISSPNFENLEYTASKEMTQADQSDDHTHPVEIPQHFLTAPCNEYLENDLAVGRRNSNTSYETPPPLPKRPPPESLPSQLRKVVSSSSLTNPKDFS